MFSNSGVDAVSVGDSLFGSLNSATEKAAAQPKTINSHDVSEQEVMDFILGEELTSDMDFLNPLASLEDSSSQDCWTKKENNLGPEAPDRRGLESFVQSKMNKHDSKKESELLSGFSSKRSRSIKDDSSSAKHVKFDSSSKDCPPSVNNIDFLQRSPKRSAAAGRKNSLLQSSKTSQFHPSTVTSNYNRNSMLANNSHHMNRPQQKLSREGKEHEVQTTLFFLLIHSTAKFFNLCILKRSSNKYLDLSNKRMIFNPSFSEEYSELVKFRLQAF